jgi:hypothetical protein
MHKGYSCINAKQKPAKGKSKAKKSKKKAKRNYGY